MIHLPRIMLAAPSSGSGKTMITCGLLQALVNRGLSPASFKCGPDYIDPMFHTKVIGARSRNLDTFFTDSVTTRYLFARTAAGAGISVLEGVMGIYDGLGGVNVKASSFDLACVTDTPVILIVNARGMSLSVVPLIQGYLDYQKKLGREMIRGVILNQTTRMTCMLLKPLIEEQTGIRVFGYVPRLPDCIIESRHLGLVTPDEITDLKQTLQRLSGQLEECLDMEEILKLAEEAADYEERETQMPEEVQKMFAAWQREIPDASKKAQARPKIAVAVDEAFCFYYQDNLDLIEEAGAEIVEFSPLHETHLPEGISGLILGGGYPELYAEPLSRNKVMMQEIKASIQNGIPYLAECGGFMYLHEMMEDMDGREWPMCGAIAGKSYRTSKLGRFGYITLTSRKGSSEQDASGAGQMGAGQDASEGRQMGAVQQLLSENQQIRGHEFHYFDSTSPGCDYEAQKPASRRSWTCIHGTDHSAAGYPHLYYWSNPEFILRFLQKVNQQSMQYEMRKI